MAGGLLLGGLISGGLGLAKSIFGGVQAAKAQKKMNKLMSNRPTYQIPEAYQKMLGIYQNMAQGEMPGQSYYENMIGQTTARALSNAERGAISSQAFQGSVLNAQDKELEALNNLALMGVQYKTQQMQNLAGAQEKMGQLQDTAFEYNKNQPWQMQMNMAAGNRQAGMQNLFGGLGEIGSSVMNLVGTKYYADMLKGLQGGASNGKITQQPYSLMQSSSPQENLLNTLGGMLPKIK